MTVEEAVAQVQQRFPIRDYVHPEAGGYTQVAETVLRYLKPGAKVLDFASGACDKTAVLQLLGYRCTAYDDFQDPWHKWDGLQERLVAFANQLGIDLRIATERTLPFEPESFDMVMAHHVLEHLHDSPRDLLNDMVGLLRPGGYLFITVPNAVNIRKRVSVMFGKTNMSNFDFFYWYPGPWRGHVREYTKGDLRSLATNLRIEIIELTGVDHLLIRLPRSLRSVFRAATALCRGFKDTWCLVARRPQGWTPMKELPPERLEHIYRSLGGRLH